MALMHRARPASPAPANGLVRIPIAGSEDIVTARQEGRALAARLDFGTSDLTVIATAISEVARNIVEHAGKGEIVLHVVRERGRRALSVVARDRGPGIRDVEQALKVGWSTGKGLGLGLPGARRLMDEFQITSVPGKGTTVVMRKWAP